MTNIITPSAVQNLFSSKTKYEDKQIEENFQKALTKLEDFEDPLKIFLDYIKWLEENKSKSNQIRIIEVLEKMTKTLHSISKYKQDDRFLKKWLSYATSCSDGEEILNFMKENEIGTNFVMFYEVFALIYEKKRDFLSTNKILLEGLQRKAQPTDKINNLIKEFEQRMIQRLDRDFYSQALFLKDEKQNFDIKDSKNIISSKKRKLVENEPSLEFPLKRMKLIESKAREKLKVGEIEIFVDEPFRNNITISTQLVDEYQALCKKYNFCKENPVDPLQNPTSKPLSWISRENFLYSMEINENTKKNKDPLKFAFEKQMPKISEEGSSINSSENTKKNSLVSNAQNKTPEIQKEGIIEKNEAKIEEKSKENPHEIVKITKEENNKEEKKKEDEKFLDFFSKKIEENLRDFFVFPITKKSTILQSSQNKNGSVLRLSNSTHKSNQKTDQKQDNEPSFFKHVLNFEDVKNSTEGSSSFNSELEEIKKISFEKYSGFFSNEKDRFFGQSFKKENSEDYEIENLRNTGIIFKSGSPKRKCENGLTFESFGKDQAFLMDSNEKVPNESKEEFVELLRLIDENDDDKENVSKKIRNAPEGKKNNERKALQELPIEEAKIPEKKIELGTKGCQEKNNKDDNYLKLFTEDDEDFDIFFRKTVLNSGFAKQETMKS